MRLNRPYPLSVPPSDQLRAKHSTLRYYPIHKQELRPREAVMVAHTQG